jgi:hypothetical protein
MAIRKTTSNKESTPLPPPSLVMPRGEADKQLVIRIEAGSKLHKANIHTEQELGENQRLFDIWHDYNRELLRRMFDTEEVSEEYIKLWSRVGYYALEDRIESHRNDIVLYIGRLESIKSRLPLCPELNQQVPGILVPDVKRAPVQTRTVFVVHGRDEGSKEKVARFLEKLKIEAKILHEQPNKSKTLMEKLESHSKVAFAVVLLTPDDEGKLVSDATPLSPRARQNVVFELGYFIGLLGREKVCALMGEGVEKPSDFDGISYIPFDKLGAWQFLLVREIKAAGLDIDLNNAI